MPVITMSRECASGGDEIAAEVAARLGLRLVGREMVNAAARQAGVPEVALAEIDELGLLGVKTGRPALQAYHSMMEQLSSELAAGGDVMLLGRGFQVVLSDHPGILHVRVIAPRAWRIQRLQNLSHLTAEAAAALLDARDKARAEHVRRHYGAQLDAPTWYDLVLNMAHLTIQTAADIVCTAAMAVQRQAAGRDHELG